MNGLRANVILNEVLTADTRCHVCQKVLASVVHQSSGAGESFCRGPRSYRAGQVEAVQEPRLEDAPSRWNSRRWEKEKLIMLKQWSNLEVEVALPDWQERSGKDKGMMG